MDGATSHCRASSFERANEALSQAHDRACEAGARVLESEVHACRAALERRRGDEAAWRCELETAARLFTAVAAPARAAAIARELGA
jgi:hypothetical protein